MANTSLGLKARLRDCGQRRLWNHFESGGALAGRGTFVYDQNQMILCPSQAERKFLKYGVSTMSEMAFTESLVLQKGHFLSSKKGTFFPFKKYFFRSLNGAL
jgi:hypothetical protein